MLVKCQVYEARVSNHSLSDALLIPAVAEHTVTSQTAFPYMYPGGFYVPVKSFIN
ncbi:hypothetical protein EXN66_Car003406 [Channa argus]|uniref:Uncharacterized protein n=1 Tax=Channa argus TaxID=215402 RepID=A0A6G1PC87_CHAAH|nr:hypothetical protein EXN66_Car003406 [Channa argus]